MQCSALVHVKCYIAIISRYSTKNGATTCVRNHVTTIFLVRPDPIVADVIRLSLQFNIISYLYLLSRIIDKKYTHYEPHQTPG